MFESIFHESLLAKDNSHFGDMMYWLRVVDSLVDLLPLKSEQLRVQILHTLTILCEEERFTS